MRIEYENSQLERLASDRSYKPKRWSHALIKAYRKQINRLQAATDIRDLYKLKSLHLEKLAGNYSGHHSIRLNDQFRLIIRFPADKQKKCVVIREITDYH